MGSKLVGEGPICFEFHIRIQLVIFCRSMKKSVELEMRGP